MVSHAASYQKRHVTCGITPFGKTSVVSGTDRHDVAGLEAEASMQRSLKLEQAPRIDRQEAKAEFDNHAALFVDVRSSEEYDRCRIPGAISVPLV